MVNVLAVCQGNTCRSPMVEAMLRAVGAALGAPISAESVGMLEVAQAGNPAAEHSIGECRRRGIDLSAHRSRHISQVDLRSFDIIFCATPQEKAEIARLYPDFAPRTRVLDEENGGISNPYGKDVEIYRQCADQIWTAVTRFALNPNLP